MELQSTKYEVIVLLVSFFGFSNAFGGTVDISNLAQARSHQTQPAQAAAAPPTATPVNPRLSPFVASGSIAGRATDQYRPIWGIDNIQIQRIASGALIRFSYRVRDPNKAKALNDGKLKSQLVEDTSHATFQNSRFEIEKSQISN